MKEEERKIYRKSFRQVYENYERFKQTLNDFRLSVHPYKEFPISWCLIQSMAFLTECADFLSKVDRQLLPFPTGEKFIVKLREEEYDTYCKWVEEEQKELKAARDRIKKKAKSDSNQKDYDRQNTE